MPTEGIKELTCPNCGAGLERRLDVYACEHCGTEIRRTTAVSAAVADELDAATEVDESAESGFVLVKSNLFTMVVEKVPGLQKVPGMSCARPRWRSSRQWTAS